MLEFRTSWDRWRPPAQPNSLFMVVAAADDDKEAHSVQIITGNFGHLEYSWVLLKKDPWIGCMGTKGPSGACISYNQVHVSVAQGELCEMHEFQNLHKLRYLEMS